MHFGLEHVRHVKNGTMFPKEENYQVMKKIQFAYLVWRCDAAIPSLPYWMGSK